jgi:hypothetical protein
VSTLAYRSSRLIARAGKATGRAGRKAGDCNIRPNPITRPYKNRIC